MASLSWILDITEYDDNDGVENTFSAHVSADDEEVITIADFRDRIEAAIDNREFWGAHSNAPAGGTDRTYEVNARPQRTDAIKRRRRGRRHCGDDGNGSAGVTCCWHIPIIL